MQIVSPLFILVEFCDKRYLVMYAYKMSKIFVNHQSNLQKNSSHLLIKGQIGFDLEILIGIISIILQ